MKIFERNKSINYQKPIESLIEHYKSQNNLINQCQNNHQKYQINGYTYYQSDLLGKGFSSNVYYGCKTTDKTKNYAIKKVDFTQFKSEYSWNLLEQQIAIHLNLIHDNIIRCYQVILKNQSIYLILQYCPNGNLKDYLKKQKKLSQYESIQIMQQLLSAYKYLLKKGIIHRDLKPSNILKVGNQWKIADFGFAIQASDKFKQEYNVGTPLYMPYEAIKENIYSPKTDFFALGIILYEILCGKTPWKYINRPDLLLKMKSLALDIPNFIKNRQLRFFIQKCCQIDIEKRISVTEFQKNILNKKYNRNKYNLLNNDIITINSEIKITNPEQINYLSQNIFFKVPLKQQKKSQNQQKFHLDSTQKSKFNKKSCKNYQQNTNKLIQCLQNGQHIYYMIQNQQQFLIENDKHKVFIFILYKLLIHSINVIKYIDQNPSQQWQIYQQSQVYKKLKIQIQYCRIDYQNIYLNFVELIDIAQIKILNGQFPQLSENQNLKDNFYNKLSKFFIDIMLKQLELLNKRDPKSSQIQALQSTYQLYEIIQNRQIYYDQHKNYDTCNIIKIITNYKNSQLIYDDYIKLRKNIQNL